MPININDMSKLEIKYRKVLKCMMSMPDCTPSALVYLAIGILPAEAQRDLEILSLLGQLAMADEEIQNVLLLIKHNLAFFDGGFAEVKYCFCIAEQNIVNWYEPQNHSSILNVPQTPIITYYCCQAQG